MTIRFIIVFALLTVASPASAELPVEKFLAHKSDPTIKNWVYGVGIGFSWANAALISAKQRPLYCVPAHFYVEAENYNRILLTTIEDLSKVLNSPVQQPNAQIEPILLIGLQKAFPCP